MGKPLAFPEVAPRGSYVRGEYRGSHLAFPKCSEVPPQNHIVIDANHSLEYKILSCGSVAQSVEQWPFKPLVPGSSPGRPTKLPFVQSVSVSIIQS
jgi:hypothetical protein